MEKKFEEMSIKEKIEAIEEVLKKDIMPMLAFDGGYAEVVDVRDANNDETHVFIRYGGACAACSSAGGATLFAIEETLRKRLNTDKIRVFPL
jgi:Fe-S cluster biogenesis protein NfuA